MRDEKKIERLKEIAKLVRYLILSSTTKAGSGHPTTAMSATELMVALFFGQLKFDLKNPKYPNNDRVIFSKGHASPLLYSLYATAGGLSFKELNQLRKFDSTLEGHPTPRFKYEEIASGSLGQGLSVGLGMALNAKYLDKLPYKTYVLLGDSEMAEGSVWEAIQLASHYKLDNLVGMIDVNRLGQANQTMLGHNLKAYKNRVKAFGWRVKMIDGHNLNQITKAYSWAQKSKNKPSMIVAKTIKGKGVSFLEDKQGWHGKPLNQEELARAIKELGTVDQKLKGKVSLPEKRQTASLKSLRPIKMGYKSDELVATRVAYGKALSRVGRERSEIVSLDAEVKNSTFAETFEKAFPKRFFEMYIAEQNMVGTALGLSKRGKIPFISSFAAFLTRAYDQLRMASYSQPNIKVVGSHAGVSIGQDGPSQMGLEDIAMMRALAKSTLLYPSDAVSAERMVELAARHKGLVYIRTTRSKMPIIYKYSDKFAIGGSQTLFSSKNDLVTVVVAGITVHEALKSAELLKKQKINIRVIDAYSIKPIDIKTLNKAARETKAIITVEDHRPEGGLGEAVMEAVGDLAVKVYKLAVNKIPRSGTTEELMDYEEISARAIEKRVKACR